MNRKDIVKKNREKQRDREKARKRNFRKQIIYYLNKLFFLFIKQRVEKKKRKRLIFN